VSKNERNWLERAIDRRTVLKGMGAATALGGVNAASLVRAQADPGLPNYESFSKISTSHWCSFTGHVKGGRLTHVTPLDFDPEPSPIIQGLSDLVYSPSRVKYPMIRKGFYENRGNSDTTKRGAEPFVRVSWDEALDIVADEVKRVSGTFGNESIYAGSYGWQSAGRFNSAGASLQRFMNLAGGFVDDKGNYSWEVRPVIMPYVIGASSPESTYWPAIIDNSTLIVAFGLAGIKNNEMNRGGVNHNATHIKALKDKGTPVVSFNPTQLDFDIVLGTERKAIRPNTDTALMLALMHTLYTEGLHDQDFIDSYTYGFEKFLPYLTGESDGQPKSAEWAEGITEVEADFIRQLARRMANNRTMILTGASLQRADHGEQPEWAIVALASMLGQIGLPGGGFMFPAVLAYAVPRGTAPSLGGLSSGSKPIDKFIPISRWAEAFRNPGMEIDYDGQKLTYPDIRLVYWAGGNPFHHHQDTNRLIEAWRKPETIIVNEYAWTATAKHADIVLPATTTLERNDIHDARDKRYIFAMPKFVDPIFEARSDFEIFTGLAERMGFAEQYTEGKDEMTWIREFYDGARERAAAAAPSGMPEEQQMPDFDTFWENGYVEFPLAEGSGQVYGYKAFREDPALNPVGTPSGRIQFYSEELAGYDYDDCPPHVSWIEPTEWLGSEKAQQFPLHVLANHPKYRLHSQLANTYLRHLHQVADREEVWINPADAEARGIRNGDVVRLFNDRGQALAGAVVTDYTRPGVLKLSEGGWYDPMEPGVIGTLDKHGNINTLAMDKGSSKLAQGNPGHTMLVELEKWEEEVPLVTAFVPPPGAW
jgi:molybdopterin guanine dinucleotide-containing S/N-oxide reductase-like protein